MESTTRVNTVAKACADCLEEAGGRQRHHRISWQVDMCGCCGHRRAVTAPENFGNPSLQPQVLQLYTPERAEA